MDERIRQVHDHIATLRAEADAIRLVRAGGTLRRERSDRGAGPSKGFGFRRRAGRALMALGGLLEGPAHSEAARCTRVDHEPTHQGAAGCVSVPIRSRPRPAMSTGHCREPRGSRSVT